MILLLLGPALILLGVILLGNQLSSLADLKTTVGTLIGYEKNPVSGEFHPIVSFNYKTDKHYFRNANSLEFPRQALGSEQTVYYDPAKSAEIFGSPLKATLGYSKNGATLPWLLIVLGIFSIWLFLQLATFYFVFILVLVALKYFYRWARYHLRLVKLFKSSAAVNINRFPLNDTFPEDKLKLMKVLDLSSLRIYREQWLTRQTSLGTRLAVVAGLCFLLSAYGMLNEKPIVAKDEPKRELLTAEQVLDAGSAEAAEDKFGPKESLASHYCLTFKSNSCYFSYVALDPADTDKLLDQFFDLLLIDLGFILLVFAIICFNSRKIFMQHDTVDSTVLGNRK